MKLTRFENQEDWLEARRGKITGSRAGDIISKAGPTKEMICRELEVSGVEFKKSSKKEELEVLLTKEAKTRLCRELPKKVGYYEIIAERLGVSGEDESDLDRGILLECEAIAEFVRVTGKVINTDLVIWAREDNKNIAVSPDGYSETEPIAVEAKCLSSAHHIEAYLTQDIPDEYRPQMLQYFAVNDKLERLYFCFYDPRLTPIPFFYIEIKRENVQSQVEELLAQERVVLEEIDQVVNSITF